MYVNNNIALYQDRREQLMVNGRLDFDALLTTVEGLKRSQSDV